jgi:hypothetical protein
MDNNRVESAPGSQIYTQRGRLWYDYAGQFGMAYCVVPRTQKRSSVIFTYPDESDTRIGGRTGYPIPEEAKTNPAFFEDYNSSLGNRHMLLLQKDDWYLYELVEAYWDGTTWRAGSGAIWDLKRYDVRPLNWTSSDASGMQLLPGLPRYDELYLTSVPIKHAFRFAVNTVDGYVWPATHTGSHDAGGIPCGARLRMKASFNIGSYLTGLGITGADKVAMQKLLQAMKTYGLICTDRCGKSNNMTCQGTLDERWDISTIRKTYINLFVENQVQAGAFEVVRLGWSPDKFPPPKPRFSL